MTWEGLAAALRTPESDARFDAMWGKALGDFFDAFRLASLQPHVEGDTCIHCIGLQVLKGPDDSNGA